MVNVCKVQILEILDDSFYPGICRAVLEDYYNHKHFFVDKGPDDIESEKGCFRFIVSKEKIK